MNFVIEERQLKPTSIPSNVTWYPAVGGASTGHILHLAQQQFYQVQDIVFQEPHYPICIHFSRCFNFVDASTTVPGLAKALKDAPEPLQREQPKSTCFRRMSWRRGNRAE